MESSSTHYPAQSQVGPTDSSSSVATIRYVSQRSMSGEHQQLHQHLRQILKKCMLPCHENICHEKVYTNEQLFSLLKELVTLGRCAKSDLARIKKLRSSEAKVIGLTGACLQDSMRQKEIPEDIQQHEEQVALMDDKMQQVQGLLQSSQKQLQEVKSWFLYLSQLIQSFDSLERLLEANEIQKGSGEAAIQRSLAEHTNQEQQLTLIEEQIRQKIENCSCLKEFAGQLDLLMAAWRKVQALEHANLIAPIKEDQWMDLSALFKEYFDCQQKVDSQINGKIRMREIKTRMMEIRNRVLATSWCWIKQPDMSIKSSTKIKVSIRLFGLTAKDVQSRTEVYVFPESDLMHRFSKEYLCSSVDPDLMESTGDCGSLREVTVTYTNILVDKKTESVTKKKNASACCEQLYRVCLRVSSAEGSWPVLECLSLPFTIRTGSSQLWESVGVITSLIFSVENLYQLPSQCPKELSINQVLTKAQAMLMARDPERRFHCDEVKSLKRTLRKLTSTDKISITKLVMDPMPWHGRNKGEKNKISFFNWFIAALNTYTKVNTGFLSGNIFFVSYEQCKSDKGRVPAGSCLVRVSRNEVDGPSGKTPTAKIVVHIYSQTEMLSYIISVQDLQEYSLLTHLKHVKDEKGKELVKSILPMNILLQNLKDTEDTMSQEKSNGYFTRYRDMKGDTILSQGVERLSIKSDDNDEDHYSCENDPINDAVPSKIPRTVSPGPPSSVAIWQGFGGGMSENISGQTGGGWMSENISVETGGGGMLENISGETGGGGMSENTHEDSWRNIEPTLYLDTDENEDSLIDTYDPVQSDETSLYDLLSKCMGSNP